MRPQQPARALRHVEEASSWIPARYTKACRQMVMSVMHLYFKMQVAKRAVPSKVSRAPAVEEASSSSSSC